MYNKAIVQLPVNGTVSRETQPHSLGCLKLALSAFGYLLAHDDTPLHSSALGSYIPIHARRSAPRHEHGVKAWHRSIGRVATAPCAQGIHIAVLVLWKSKPVGRARVAGMAHAFPAKNIAI